MKRVTRWFSQVVIAVVLVMVVCVLVFPQVEWTLVGPAAGYVLAVSINSNSGMVASGWADSKVRLWDANTGHILRTLTGHTNSVHSVAFSPDGNTVASGSSDNTVKLWNASTGALIRTLTGGINAVFFSVAFSPDGNTIASGSSDTMECEHRGLDSYTHGAYRLGALGGFQSGWQHCRIWFRRQDRQAMECEHRGPGSYTHGAYRLGALGGFQSGWEHRCVRFR